MLFNLVVRADLQRKHFWLEGVFCSWNCSKAYCSSLASHQRALAMSYLSYLRSQFEHAKCDLQFWDVSCAPHWTLLKEYGGYMTIDEFRTAHCRDTRLLVFPSNCSIMPLGYDCFEEDPAIPVPATAIKRVRDARDNWNRPPSLTKKTGGSVYHFFGGCCGNTRLAD